MKSGYLRLEVVVLLFNYYSEIFGSMVDSLWFVLCLSCIRNAESDVFQMNM